jgi:plastocyanin
MKRSNLFAAFGMTALLALAACGDSAPPAATAGPGTDAAAAPSVTPTGNVVVVEMISGNGEIFAPDEVTVQRGDVVRFKLVAGVHNASFPASKNPRGVKLPAATPYLQVPGQTYDLLVDLPAGTYNYQCDPHVALGMFGTLHVTD